MLQDSNFNRDNWEQLANKIATYAVLATGAMRYAISDTYANDSELTLAPRRSSTEPAEWPTPPSRIREPT